MQDDDISLFSIVINFVALIIIIMIIILAVLELGGFKLNISIF